MPAESDRRARAQGAADDRTPGLADATSSERHLAPIVPIFRAFIAFVTVSYAGLIGILCAHWLKAGDRSVLFLGLLPAAMLVFLNVVAWKSRATG